MTFAESRAEKLSITNHLNSTVQGIISKIYNKLAFICTFPSISFDCIARTLKPCVCSFSLWSVLDFFCWLELSGWSFILGLGKGVYFITVLPLHQTFLYLVNDMSYRSVLSWLLFYLTLFTNSHEPLYDKT